MELSSDEVLNLRKFTLERAVMSTPSSRPDDSVPTTEEIVARAKAFEDYLLTSR